MEEILRFQQLRQAQKLAGEQKSRVGISLYPDNNLSDLAQQLRKVGCGKGEYSAIFQRLLRSKYFIREEHQIDTLLLGLYHWLDFKARPVKWVDFEDYVKSISENKEPDLHKQWTRMADSLLWSIYNNDLCSNYTIDYQLLIRLCHIYRRCVVFSPEGWKAQGNKRLLNEILTLPVLIPTAVLRSRCCEMHSDKSRSVLPEYVVPTDPAGAKRCECKCNESCQSPDRHCICIRTYVADLFIVKEKLARYEAGDIASIENILAGEKKVRRHRNFYRTEDTLESETETVTLEERDHQVGEKFSLQSEVKNTVDSKVHVDAGVTATIKYGEAVTLNPHANVTGDFSKSQSENIARSYSKEIIDRSVSKIQEKIRRLQVSKVINELEEINKHSIDNTEAGSGHRAGIYYWVNKVTHAQVYNYSKHLMFDMIIPEPAATFKKLFQLKQDQDKKLLEPEKPVVTPLTISRQNYGDLLSKYFIATTEEIHPPDEVIYTQFAFSQNLSETDPDKTAGFSSHDFRSPEIPKGYKATDLDYHIVVSTGHPKNTGPMDEVAISVHVGRELIFHRFMNERQQGGGQPNFNWQDSGTITMNGEQGTVNLSLSGFTTLGFSLSGTVSLKCKLTDEAFEKWQTKIYNLIMADYNRKLEAFKAANSEDNSLIQIKGRNPFLNREIERNEFKRHVIAILMCNYFNGMGSMMERVSPCGYPEINFEKLERDAPVIQFFEQVFEWNYLTYLFYHSMWARKCKWPELIDEDSGDPLFDKFLMAGAARVQVPIRRGMEEIFSWFLTTGQIWGSSGLPPVSGDDEYVSMIQELKEAKQCDYTDRPGLLEVNSGSNIFKLTGSTFYWDLVNDEINSLNLENDINREILVNYEIYRIVQVEQANASDNSSWNITVERNYEGASAQNLTHAVGALFVGTPWEIVIPTKLVYLRNEADKLPEYPLS
jgi:hypothetical protein